MSTKEERDEISRAKRLKATTSAMIEICARFGEENVITKENKHIHIARRNKEIAERNRRVEIAIMLQRASKDIEKERDIDLRESMGYGQGRRMGD